MPPSTCDGRLHATGPCAILTPRFVRGDFVFNLQDLATDWKKDTPADEQFFEIVFGWDNAAGTHAFTVEASGFVHLVSRLPDSLVHDEAQAGPFNNLTLTRQGTMVALLADGRPILSGDFPDVPSGRVGLNLGLGVAGLNTQFSLETAVAGDGDATLL